MGFWETVFGVKPANDERVDRLEIIARSYELHEPNCAAHDLDKDPCACWLSKDGRSE